MEVLGAVEQSAEESLPSTGGGNSNGCQKKGGVAGWNEYVKPYHQESKFWHNLWDSAGRPITGDLFKMMRQAKYQFKYAYRRVQRASNKLQNDKFATSILKGGINIFDAIKKYRGKVKKCSSTIDNEVGASNIAEHFADIYCDLFNKVEQGNEINELQHSLNQKITNEDMFQVHRVTEDVVKQGLSRMKGSKSDVKFNFQSDCLINGPPELVTHLTNLLRLFISHGVVPYFILVCSLLPLLKDNLGDITSSDNYRAIAAGSQLLKLLDIVILILEGDKLKCDQLQFGFQPKASTSMCSWAATAVIDHYNRQGAVVYGCAMDLSKAFDMVEWLNLFNVLASRNVAPVFLRTLLFIYSNQTCDVKWNGSCSRSFRVSNGVRQGAVSSPILFSIYINDLFFILRNSGLGCRIHAAFFGCLGYADDLLLLSASRSGLQSMVNICAGFAREKNLKFSTNPDPIKSKTKGIIFAKKPKDRLNILPVKLNGDDLPWVSDVKHLGNFLDSGNSMKKDITTKKGQFIGKVNSLLQEFHYVTPDIFMKIVNIYAVSFHGSCLWDLFSADCDHLYRAWNVAVRLAWNVPNTTHRYLIEPLSETLHPKVMLSSRYVSFVKSLSSSPKYVIRVLASLCIGDLRTVLGRTLQRLAAECKCDISSLSPVIIKKHVKYFSLPRQEEWRVPILRELTSQDVQIPGFTPEEIQVMTDHLCST